MPAGWRVFTSRQVLDRWETRSSYSAEALVAYWDWVLARTQDGPPDDALRVYDDEDLFLALVPGTTLVVSFLAITQDQALIVKDIA